MSSWPHAILRAATQLCPLLHPECTHPPGSLACPGHCKGSPSPEAAIRCLPCPPWDTADDTSIHSTRLVQKCNTIHTSHPSSLPFPRTPSSGRIGPPPLVRSSRRRSKSEGSIHPPALSSTLSSTCLELASPTSQEPGDHVILPPQRWESLPFSSRTELAVQEGPLYDISISSPSEAVPRPLATVKQNQYSKLRRHLGASIPPELVYGDQGGVKISSCIAPVLQKVSEEEQENICWKVIPESYEEEDSSEESESEEGWESWHGDMLEVRRAPPHPDSANERYKDGYRGKWMREQGGRRWLISNYEDVVQALREL